MKCKVFLLLWATISLVPTLFSSLLHILKCFFMLILTYQKTHFWFYSFFIQKSVSIYTVFTLIFSFNMMYFEIFIEYHIASLFFNSCIVFIHMPIP